jgi:hypothetical protein
MAAAPHPRFSVQGHILSNNGDVLREDVKSRIQAPHLFASNQRKRVY